MSQRPRVAMLGLRSPGSEGGVERAVASLAPRLVDLGFEVTIWCRAGYPVEPASGVRIRQLPAPRARGWEALIHSALALAPAAWEADLVHLHAVGPGGLAPVCRAVGRPVVVTWHGLDWRREKWGRAGRVALRTAGATATAADALICVSREIWEHADHPRAVWIPNGVDPLPLGPLDRAGIPGLSAGYLLFVGRLAREKAVETAIGAHARQPSAPPLVIAGSDAQDPRWNAHLRAMATARVVFAGERTRAEVGALVHHASAVLFPSRLEGYPIALLEAVAAGRPVLASDIPPHREILGREGLLPCDDVEAWAAAIADLARAPRPPPRVATLGWDAIAARTASVYEAVLARPACRRRRSRGVTGWLAEPRAALLR